MLTLDQTLAFLLASFLLTVAPGPDNLMVLSMGTSRGKRSGIAFGLGCALGCLSHTALAVVGVGALIAASPLVFGALKLVGGAYLMWLGVQALRHAGDTAATTDKMGHAGARQLFFKGIMANAINPKIVLFFLSFLPQFVNPTQGDVTWQLGLLGLLFTTQAALIFVLLGYFSGVIGHWLNRTPRVSLWMNRLAGGVFVALGLRMVTAR